MFDAMGREQARPVPASLSDADRAALIDQLETNIPRLRRYARSLTRDQHRADDLVQDTLIRALDKLHLFELGTNLIAWLFTMMRNIHINELRTARRMQEEDPSELTVPAPENQLDALALKDLARAMASLPADQRETVMLVAVEGLAYQDVAEIMDVPIGTVRSRLSRARERLKALVTGEEEGEGSV